MSDETIPPHVEEVVSEAQKEFDLFNAITNPHLRSRKLNLGFDEENAEKLAVAEAAMDRINTAVAVLQGRIGNVEAMEEEIASLKRKRTGDHTEAISNLQAKLDLSRSALEKLEETRARYAEIEKDAAALRDIVRANSLSIELRALPAKLRRGVVRRTRKALDITEKGVPEERMEEFTDQYYLELASDQIIRWRDNRTMDGGSKLSAEQIRNLIDWQLPEREGNRLLQAVSDLQERTAISEAAVAQADF